MEGVPPRTAAAHHNEIAGDIVHHDYADYVNMTYCSKDEMHRQLLRTKTQH